MTNENTRGNEKSAIVTPKTIDIFSAFAVTLKRIHIRLIAEGYVVSEGGITKSERLLEMERDNVPPKRSRRAGKQ